jgi:hypothetical protein
MFLVYHETLRSGLARGLLHAAGILLLLALVVELRRRGRDGSRAVHLTALVVAVDLVVAAAPVNFTAPEGLLGTEPESVESVREAVGIGRLYRAPDPTPRFQPPTDDRVWSMRLHMEFLSMFFASAWGVPVVGHHDVHGLSPRRAVLFFHALTEGLPWPQRLDLLAANGVTAMISGASPDETGLDPFEELIELEAQPSWLYRIPDAAAPATWVPRWVSTPDERSTVQLLARGIDPLVAVVEGGEGSGPTVCDGAARAAIRRRSRESWTVEVDADCPGLLVLSVGSYPGWKTEVDGTPVSSRPANLLSTAVPIPAGRHLVEHRFEPLSPRLGALVSLVTLLALLGWARVRRER